MTLIIMNVPVPGDYVDLYYDKETRMVREVWTEAGTEKTYPLAEFKPEQFPLDGTDFLEIVKGR